jgi:NAD(P)-dependent dehydrogenase (short-subunit alcohol dehydrogenase family)
MMDSIVKNRAESTPQALVPIGRVGEPEEIASVVEMLVKNEYMTNKARLLSVGPPWAF